MATKEMSKPNFERLNLSSSSRALELLSDKIIEMNKSRRQTLTLSIDELNAVFASISSLVVSNINLQEQVANLQKKNVSDKNSETIIVKLDAGRF